MKTWQRRSLFSVLVIVCFSLSYAVTGEAFLPNGFGASMTGYEEVPPVFTSGNGFLQVSINSSRTAISYQLSYGGKLSSAVTQAHIHFGERPVNGGIIVYLCDNTGKAPSGTPACPSSGTVNGTLTAAAVNPPKNIEPVTAQGIAPGNFAGLLGAIERGDAYGNVHTTNFPAGEIRGWLR